MEITWYGHSCFRLTERGLPSIVVDPYDDSVGYAVPRLKADIVTVSDDTPAHNNVQAVKSVKHVIDGPGEYEIGGIFITAAATFVPKTGKTPPRRNLMFSFDYGNVIVGHLGNLSHVPAQSEIEVLGSIDVALTPVGGGTSLTSAQAAEVVSLLEPGIVVPMHYKTPATSLKLDSADKFLKEMGLSEAAQEESLKISARSSMPDQTEVVLLEYQNNQ